MSQQINLFNPIFRKQKKYFSSVTMLQALGIICVFCALLVLDASNRARDLQRQLAAADARVVAREARLAEVRAQFPPRAKNKALQDEIKAAERELQVLVTASDTVRAGGFGDTRGFSEYFRAFARQRVEGLWLTEVTVGAGGSQLGVQGNTLQAELVPQYMQRLAREPVMKGKVFRTLEIGAPVVQEGAPAATPAQSAPSYLSFSLQSAPPAPAIAAVSK